MKFLTRAQYARLKGITKQAVGQKIKRGKLKTVFVEEKVERIPVDDKEFENVKVYELTR